MSNDSVIDIKKSDNLQIKKKWNFSQYSPFNRIFFPPKTFIYTTLATAALYTGAMVTLHALNQENSVEDYIAFFTSWITSNPQIAEIVFGVKLSLSSGTATSFIHFFCNGRSCALQGKGKIDFNHLHEEEKRIGINNNNDDDEKMPLKPNGPFYS